jgi:drug/metabolite transporter (DMT)-like permease
VTGEERRGLLLVVIAVFLFSISPVLIRWAADSLTAYEITAGRLLVAGVLVFGIAILRQERLPRRNEWPRFAFYGLVAALHFALYIASLSYTSIAHSLALVYTAPIFVALFSWIYLGERLRPRQWMGILIAVGGVGVLAGFEPAFTQRMLIGDLLALGSALCFGIYSVAGRSQRDRYQLIAYAGTVYVMATFWLLPAALLNFSPQGYTIPAILSVLALGIFPLGIGHTLYNAALRRVSATYVNLIATQEVTGGILLGILFLSEMPSFNSVVGALITLGGIILVVL